MNAKDVLNADVEVVWQWIRQGAGWWLAELEALLPADWRERLAPGPATVAELRDNRLIVRAGVPAAPRLPLVTPAPARVRIVLPRELLLVREMEVPALPLSDVRRMVALDIDRLTPFRPDTVLFDVVLIGGAAASGKQRALLGVIRRETAERVLSLAAAQNLAPVEMRIANANPFDFMPAARQMEGAAPAARKLYWWGAVAGLAAANLLLLIARDVTDLDRLRDATGAQASSIAVAERIGDKVEAEQARRAALLDARARNAPLPVLDAATRAIPAGSWATRLEWNGRSVHVAGFRDPKFDIMRAFESSPLFRNAKATVAQGGSGNQQAFDLTADRDPRSLR